MIATKKLLSVLFISALAAIASAADYYVASDGTYDGAPDGATVYASLDEAIAAAENDSDVIYAEPGTYTTTTQNGPNLKAKLVGAGANRGDVIIQSSGSYRTLRMAAGSWLENVTVVGEGTWQVDKGGAIEMSGGTVTNCVVRDGTAKANNNLAGGNIYVSNTAALISGCDIYGGSATNRGGNVYVASGTLRNCTISNGVSPNNIGGNVYLENGTLNGCTLTGGSAGARGGNIFMNHASARVENCTISSGNAVTLGGNIFINNASAVVTNSTVSSGTAGQSGGNIYISNGTVVDSTISDGIANGTSWDHGGGNVLASPGRLTRCVITGGSFAYNNQGGGIRSRNADTVIEDCLVYGNANGGICLEGKGKHFNNTVVNNEAYGIWGYGSNPGTFVNCIVYGNHTETAINEWAGNHPAAADMHNCAFGQEYLKGTVAVSTYAGSIYLADDSAFADYANGDYHTAAVSVLVDAGAMDSRTDASALDLDMKPRQSGTIDIGCYEYQKSEMTVNFAYAEQLDHSYAPATAVFSVSANNVPDGQTASFSIDFGDGLEPVVTAGPTVSHTFENPGVYTIVVTASAPGSADAEMTYSNFVTLKSQTVYVTAGNTSPAAPYSTVETGFATFADAYNDAVDGMTIIVGNGVYEQTAKIAVSKAVSIVGNAANPDAVVLKNTATASSGQGDKRVMSIDNAAATVCGLTLEGGQVYHGNGGNLAISAGMISNCVIRGGIALADTDAEYGMGAGVALSGSGIVSHCIITNNEVQGAASGKWAQGSAVVFPWGSSGKMLNCLVAYNRWTIENAEANGAAGVVYHGSTAGSRVENCTVVANAIVGTCNAASAAGIRCDWNSSVRNTVISGNRIGETVSNVLLARDGEIWKDSLNACVTEDALPSGNASCIVAALGDTFKNYARGDFRPKTGGALANKGSAVQFPVSVDLAGNPRVMFDAIDIGCYECQTKPGFAIVVR